jgi:uncharacterized repeat protein (TIGR03803 family)
MKKTRFLKSSFFKTIGIAFTFCVVTAIASFAQTFTTLHSFDLTDGSEPWAALVQGTDGNFYGGTAVGGANARGTLFKITRAGALTTLHGFDGTDGDIPSAALVRGTDGNFYGTTEQGGANAGGTVFKITAAGALTTLYSFCAQANCADGSYPYATLVQGTDGNFYGITGYGGTGQGSTTCATSIPSGCGTVFKMTAKGALTTLHSFCVQTNCPDGANPIGGLVQGTDGNFYGTTGGGAGTVFKITTAGKLTTLHRFTLTNPAGGFAPYAALVQGPDGDFYGTTLKGGADGDGTVFKITAGGTLTTLQSFCTGPGCTSGDAPSGLVLGTDGNFYGTTEYGGANGDGTVFTITAGGALTTLYSFCAQANCADGYNPRADLVQGTDGNFYGDTSLGGANGDGTVFRLSMGLGPFVKTDPTAGKVGSKVVILGNNLASATSVAFNGTSASLLKVAASAIETSVPTGATTGTITVTTANGTLDSNVAFQVLP